MVQQTLVQTQQSRYLAAFETMAKNGYAGEPPWLVELRKAAMARFRDLGFPTTRRGNEEWKYTDVGPIASFPSQPLFANPTSKRLSATEVEPFTFGGPSWNRLVFVDGNYAEHLSSLSFLPKSVSVTSLAKAIALETDLVEQHLARYADYQSNGFTALNTAFIHDGAVVHIPDHTTVEVPILLMFLHTSQQKNAVSYPRVLIVTGKDSKATIIESYGNLTDDRYFSNAVTELGVGQGSVVRYYKLQRQSDQAFHITTTDAALARDSSFHSVNLDLGGELVRNNLNVLMREEGSSCKLNGLYMVTGTQHVDNQVIIDHASSYTNADELYKGILDGHSRSVFHGSIIVRKGLQKINAMQVDKNLLLSDRAEADTKPAFWIYSDDVRCGHGAACGQMDPNALFYLQSRGISEPAARRILTRGFVSEVIDRIDNGAFRTHVDGLVQEKLGRWLGGDEAK